MAMPTDYVLGMAMSNRKVPRRWLDRQQLLRQASEDADAKTTFESMRGPTNASGCQQWAGPLGARRFCKFNFARKSYGARAFSAALDGTFACYGQCFGVTCGNELCVSPAHIVAQSKGHERPVPLNQVSQFVKQRFWERVAKIAETGCWEFSSRRTDGYGVVCYPNRGGVEGAHRYSYRLHYGHLPDNLDVCHKCDNPPCVNPEHLFLGTHKDNMRDKTLKGRGNYKQGAAHYAATLTMRQATEIRKQFLLTPSVAQVAKVRQIEPASVRSIVLGKSYRPERKASRRCIEIFVECMSLAAQHYGKNRENILTMGDVTQIRADFLRGVPLRDICASSERTAQKIVRILKGKAYSPKTGYSRNLATDKDHQVFDACTSYASSLPASAFQLPRKLNFEKAQKIRVEFAGKKTSMTVLAQKYDVTAAYIYRIVHGLAWPAK